MEIAIVVGGAECVWSELDKARTLCALTRIKPAAFVMNDMIECFPDPCRAVTLHVDKLARWLTKRAEQGYPAPLEVWGHRVNPRVTHVEPQHWSGSSGLFAAKIAVAMGMHVILCGCPMSAEGDHFVRHQRWDAALGFWRGWEQNAHKIKPYVRSFSGLTAAELGEPSAAWISECIQSLSSPHILA